MQKNVSYVVKGMTHEKPWFIYIQGEKKLKNYFKKGGEQITPLFLPPRDFSPFGFSLQALKITGRGLDVWGFWDSFSLTRYN